MEPRDVVDRFNSTARQLGLPLCRALTPNRIKSIKARVAEVGYDGLLEAIDNLHESSFCQGANDRGWRAHFDFILQPSSCVKLLEGVYRDNFVEQRSRIDAALDTPTGGGSSETIDALLSIAGK